MNTDHSRIATLVRDGAGQLISDRRARPRSPARSRNSAVMSDITLALLQAQRTTHEVGGFDPYDHRDTRKGGDVWGSKRRD